MKSVVSRKARQAWGPAVFRRRAYHFSSPVSDPATIRLYRILLRSCRELEQKQHDAADSSSSSNLESPSLLLQPPLNPHLAGLSRVFESSWPYQPGAAHHVLRLFGHWRELELNTRISSSSSSSGHQRFNETTSSSAETAEAITEEDKLIAWLAPMIAEHGADAWMDQETLWTTALTIRQAIRLAFRESSGNDENNDAAATPMDYRSWAIRAFQYLSATAEMQRLQRVQHENNVRITTLARCVGRSVSTTPTTRNENETYKYRFVYRIRIENTSTDPECVFQLLGRSWIIQEQRAAAAAVAVPSLKKGDNDKDGTQTTGKRGVVFGDNGNDSSIRVHAPQTGAVGKHPVLGPGQCFEYMSGCDLATPTGLMKGAFHFAWVKVGTPSAQVGQAVPALDDHAQHFEVPVTPFPLEPDRLPVQFGP